MSVKLNSAVTTILPVALVVGLAIGLTMEHQRRLQRAEEHRALELQLSHLDGLIESNRQLSNLVARVTPARSLSDDEFRELLRLRGEAGVLRRQTSGLDAARDENRQARAALESSLKGQSARVAATAATPDFWPHDSWSFNGYATPDAALQSCLWAVDSGDLKTLAACTTGDMRMLMELEFGGKSEAEASARAMDHTAGIKSVHVLSRELQGDDTMIFTAEFENRTETQTQKLVMKKVGNDWKLAALPQ